MNEIVAIRIDSDLLMKVDKLGAEEVFDRSTMLRDLIRTGYREKIKMRAAQQYKEGKITFSEAAHRAGLTIWDMQHYLIDTGFRSEYSLDDLQKEMRLLKKK
ncbi:MAG TPA: UPF0175 family protein [Candidatus Nanoarchaeia archaeon]|nr:UPF0175 family protein [Candidatus Nanoarchaeia archaeon]